MIHRSRFTFEETVKRLSSAIRDGGNTLFATIDQAEAARGVGLTLRPTTLLVFGNPKGGTPLMEAHPYAGLELPLKLLVWEDDAVRVAHARMADLAPLFEVPAGDARIAAMDTLLETLAGAVAA